jgi:uncharacterized membrane protein
LNSERIITIGRVFIASSMFAFGLQHVVLAKFVTRIVPGLPAWVPASNALAYVAGVGLMAASALMLFDRKHGRAVAIALGAIIVLAFIVVHLPRLTVDPINGGLWTFALKCLTLAGCAFAIAATLPKAADVSRKSSGVGYPADRWLLWLAGTFLGVFMMFCCVLHFIYAEFVAMLIPSWIPGAAFWTYFSAIALFAGGLGLLLPPTRRLAAALSGAMIFIWVLVLHIPRAVTMRSANETTAVFEALAFSGLTLIVACVPLRLANAGVIGRTERARNETGNRQGNATADRR